MKKIDSGTSQEDSRWLDGMSKTVSVWTNRAVLAGAFQTLGLILQCWFLASLLSGLFFEGRTLAESIFPMVGFAFALLIRVSAGWFREEMGTRGSVEFRSRIRMGLLDKVLNLGPAWKVSEQSGDLSSRMMEQVDGFDVYISRYLPHQVLIKIIPLSLLAAVYTQNWISGLIMTVMAPLIPLFMVLIGKGAQAEQKRQMTSLSRLAGEFLDLVRGMAHLKLTGAHKGQAEPVKAHAEDFRSRTMRVLRLAFMSSTALEFFTVLSIALVALQLGFNLLGFIEGGSWNGDLTLFSSFFILLLAPEFFLPLREYGAFYHAKAEALGAAAQIRSIYEALSPSLTGGIKTVVPGPQEITVKDLKFSYPGTEDVLRGLNFHLPPGEILSIEGPSGGGKTTVLRLLLGQLTPKAGEILVNSIPLGELDLEAWRESVGWMNQHPKLAAGTLAENLFIANRTADKDQMLDALDFAGLKAWFQTLDKGFETILGEGGRQISGGQLRRLALARVRLRPSGLLLLDEPTASLDPETKSLILDRLGSLRGEKTMIILTHHTEAAALADQRLNLIEGRLV